MIRLRRVLGAPWPVATFFHGHDVSSALKQKGCSAYRILLSNGDLFLPVSHFLRDRLVGMGAPQAKLIAAVTFMAILITILVQATTTRWLADKLGLLIER